MKIFLAPMEGVVDHQMRSMLTHVGGIDHCVTEFVRVTTSLLPRRTYSRLFPELDNKCSTENGTAVALQLLGGNPSVMAENAAQAAHYGARHIDLNFGCPAKTVNNSDGGAIILRNPNRTYDIVNAVRSALPNDVFLSAKIRLGYEDRSLGLENATACEAGGAQQLVIHARSKADAYQPPAYWHEIAPINQQLHIPVIANGEIWTPEDYWQCRKESTCEHVMIGRGLLANPGLAREIKQQAATMQWHEVLPLLMSFQQDSAKNYPPRYAGSRLKQWLHYLQLQFPEAKRLFEQIKKIRDNDLMEHALEREIKSKTFQKSQHQ